MKENMVSPFAGDVEVPAGGPDSPAYVYSNVALASRDDTTLLDSMPELGDLCETCGGIRFEWDARDADGTEYHIKAVAFFTGANLTIKKEDFWMCPDCADFVGHITRKHPQYHFNPAPRPALHSKRARDDTHDEGKTDTDGHQHPQAGAQGEAKEGPEP